MTKQLEYELAHSVKLTQKTDRITTTQIRELEEEIGELRKEVDLWRGEYDRVCSDKVKHKHGSF